jgi:hypothetical protein
MVYDLTAIDTRIARYIDGLTLMDYLTPLREAEILSKVVYEK